VCSFSCKVEGCDRNCLCKAEVALFAGELNESQPKRSAGHLESVPCTPVKRRVDPGIARGLRSRVLHLTEQAACLSSTESNLQECRKVGLHVACLDLHLIFH